MFFFCSVVVGTWGTLVQCYSLIVVVDFNAYSGSTIIVPKIYCGQHLKYVALYIG